MRSSARHFREAQITHSALQRNARADASLRPAPVHKPEAADTAFRFEQLPSDGTVPPDREKRPAAPYQRLRCASRPKPVRCSGFVARPETPESTVPRAIFMSTAKARTARCLTWRFEHQPQAIREVLQPAAPQSCLGLSPAIKINQNLNRRLHGRLPVLPYLTPLKSPLCWRNDVVITREFITRGKIADRISE